MPEHDRTDGAAEPRPEWPGTEPLSPAEGSGRAPAADAQPDATSETSEGRRRPSFVRRANLLGGLRRETRVGLAILLSFLILIGVFLTNRFRNASSAEPGADRSVAENVEGRKPDNGGPPKTVARPPTPPPVAAIRPPGTPGSPPEQEEITPPPAPSVGVGEPPTPFPAPPPAAEPVMANVEPTPAASDTVPPSPSAAGEAGDPISLMAARDASREPPRVEPSPVEANPGTAAPDGAPPPLPAAGGPSTASEPLAAAEPAAPPFSGLPDSPPPEPGSPPARAGSGSEGGPVGSPPEPVDAPSMSEALAPSPGPSDPAPSGPSPADPTFTMATPSSPSPTPTEPSSTDPPPAEPPPPRPLPPDFAVAASIPRVGADWVAIPNMGKNPSPNGRAVTRAPAAKLGKARPAGEAAEADDLIEPVRHVVRKGENFWTISRLYYGSGRYYKALWAANRDRVTAPDQLVEGTTIRVPPPETLDRSLVEVPVSAGKDPNLASPAEPRPSTRVGEAGRDDQVRRRRVGSVELALPVGSPADAPGRIAPSRRAPAAPSRAEAQYPVYEVPSDRSFHTLRSIARDTLGDPRREREILEMNRDQIDDPNRLEPGLRLVLPDDAQLGRRVR